MDKLLMIADDLTGALDAGVAFSSAGIDTCVGLGNEIFRSADAQRCAVQVTVAETRHLPKEQAYQAVYDLVRQADGKGFTCILKKTDSALRGNPGAELAAVLDASGARRICLIPAFPKMNRVTRNGIHYIDGNIPVAESVFGADPFNPVTASSVLEILAQTTDKPAYSADPAGESQPGIAFFDAETESDITSIVQRLAQTGDAGFLAGCAGLTAALPRVLQFPRKPRLESYPGGSLAVFCGSVNPISLGQCRFAENQGAPRFHLMEHGTLLEERGLVENISRSLGLNPITLFDTGSADVGNTDPKRIAQRVSRIIQNVAEGNPQCVLFIIGGDTLLAFLRALGLETIIPIAELLPGVVLSKYHYHGAWRFLISKSGGFGAENLLTHSYNMLNPANPLREV